MDAVKRIYDNCRNAPRPFFSVVIATYNRSGLLGRALDSLLAQNEGDWEAIIVDDGSTDGTSTTILPYLMGGHRIKYFKKPHVGEVPSKNKGIRSASGRFVTFLDSDDEYGAEHLRHRKSLLLLDPAIKFLSGGAKVIGNPYVPDRFDSFKRAHLKDCVVGGTFFVDRRLLLSLHGFIEIPIGADANLYDRILEAGVPMMETNISTYIYHHETPGSITNGISRRHRRARKAKGAWGKIGNEKVLMTNAGH